MAKLVVVGGFLGAGKTTLLKQVVTRLSAQGLSVGTIVNDQAPGLVDSAVLSCCGCGTQEVAGSCFCCNFPAFEEAVQSLIDIGAGVILAEPVGSCTDLAATVLQPFKSGRPDVDLAPFTVLVSPDHVREALGECESEMHPSTLYILRQQMAEADRLLLNKTDVLGAAERAELLGLLRSAFPGRDVGELSARTGDGVESWLADLLAGGDCASHRIDVDYDRYAEGEAVLGWLNAILRLQAVDGDADLLRPALALMAALHREFRQRKTAVGHVKTVIQSGGEQRTASLISLDGDVVVPDRTPLRGSRATLILNARVQAPAEELDAIARLAIASLTGPALRTTTAEFRCLTPGRPRPTYRGECQ